MTEPGKNASRVLTGLVLSATFAGSALAAEISSTVDTAQLSEKKQTDLGLYLTPSDAAKALEEDPGIVFLDVRDPTEVSFIGHPTPIDAIVPVELSALEFDAEHGAYTMAQNPNFVVQADAVIARENADKDSPVFVMCRSGGRSAAAAQALTKAGYTNVWNLVEGFEGDKDDAGQRAVNGWRNSGLPWSYKLTPEQAWLPNGQMEK